jgi:hypothetical protein
MVIQAGKWTGLKQDSVGMSDAWLELSGFKLVQTDSGLVGVDHCSIGYIVLIFGNRFRQLRWPKTGETVPNLEKNS